MEQKVRTKILLRCDTKAHWTEVNPVLLYGEAAIIVDGERRYIKIGDGENHFAELPYLDAIASDVAAWAKAAAPGDSINIEETTDGQLSFGDNVLTNIEWSQDHTKLIRHVASLPLGNDKADKVSEAVNGHLAGLDATGNLTDSQIPADHVATQTYVQTYAAPKPDFESNSNEIVILDEEGKEYIPSDKTLDDLVADINIEMNSQTYVLTISLLDNNGNIIGSSKSIDLPIESMIINATYDKVTKEIVLTLQNGNVLRVSIADLVSGLVPDTRTINGHRLNTDIDLTKADIGLGHVANTGDSNVPIPNGTAKFTTGGAYTELNKKTDKIDNGVENDIILLDDAGNLKDSGVQISRIADLNIQNGDGTKSLMQVDPNDYDTVTGASAAGFGSSVRKCPNPSESTANIITEWERLPDDKFQLAKGKNSFVSGQNNLALDKNTFATGNGNVASASAAHAWGTGSRATGKYATAGGMESIASGQGATAIGYHVTASEFGATAFGKDNTASNAEAFAEGLYNTSEGLQSHAEGCSTTASGNQSHSEGYSTSASGNNAHAEGAYSTASGSQSHASGYSTTASGEEAHTEGGYTEATAKDAHAEGYHSQATNTQAHAEGYYSIASGIQAHAEGYQTQATNNQAHAEGKFTQATAEQTHAEGYQTLASGGEAHAEGGNTVASGTDSHAGGQKTTAYGAYSFGHGLSVIKCPSPSSSDSSIISDWESRGDNKYQLAKGEGSFTEGSNNLALGKNSHAEGNGTVASASAAHSEGTGSRATGKYSHAGGLESIASGIYSFAHGFQSTASSNSSVAIGRELTVTGEGATGIGRENTVSGQHAFAGGFQSTASGARTFAFGHTAQATVDDAVAIGWHAVSGGDTTVSIGSSTNATGNFSVALGNECATAGIGAFAAGSLNHADGKYSASLGSRNTVTHENSCAFGIGLVSDATNQVLVGKYNTTTNAIFAIGSGSDNNHRQVALYIDAGNRTWISNPTTYYNASQSYDIPNLGKVQNLFYTAPSVLEITFSNSSKCIIMALINITDSPNPSQYPNRVVPGIYRATFGPADYRDLIINANHQYYINGVLASVTGITIGNSIPVTYLSYTANLDIKADDDSHYEFSVHNVGQGTVSWTDSGKLIGVPAASYEATHSGSTVTLVVAADGTMTVGGVEIAEYGSNTGDWHVSYVNE